MFFASPGCVGETLLNVLCFDIGVKSEDGSQIVPLSKETDNRSNRHTRAADARFSTHHKGVHDNSVEFTHVLSMQQVLYFSVRFLARGVG